MGMMALVGLGLSACTPWVRPEQPSVDQQYRTTLEAGITVGQTFVAYADGLSGIEVFLQPRETGSGVLRFRLRADPQSVDDLATTNVPLESIDTSGFYRFMFSPQSGSMRRYYYGQLEMEGQGSVEVGGAPPSTYLDGALYRGTQPADAQMAFNLLFDPWLALRSFAGEALTWVVLIGIGLAAFVMPGWALLSVLWPPENALSWIEQMGLSAGISLALYPVIMLWTHLVGIQLGPLYAWGPIVAGSSVLFWRTRTKAWSHWKQTGWTWFRIDNRWPDLALIMMMGLVFAVRFSVIRTIDVPMWGDSVHHTMIAQLIVDNNGLFESWRPYAELATFTYHFGFHAAVAVFHWLSGSDLPRATLWVGQVLNGLAVLAVAPLALRLSPNRWAAVGAVLVTGLLSPMPMYYVNWGRYTQLAGQVILPAAILLMWRMLEEPVLRRPSLVLASLVWGGLALTHYRVLIMALLFFVLVYGLAVIQNRWRSATLASLALGLGAGGLFLPWFIRVFEGNILAIAGARITTPAAQISDFSREYNAVGNPSFYLSWPLWIGLVFVLIWGGAMRRRDAALVGLWSVAVLIAANPDWLGLPGVGVINNFTVFIAAYIPAGCLIGAGLGWSADMFKRDLCSRDLDALRWTKRIQPAISPILIIITVAAGLWGVRQRFADRQLAQYAMVTYPDLRAIEWIKTHTPPDARFLVNSFFAYGGSVIVGSDAGWWLPLLVGRTTTLPPITYSVEDSSVRPDYRAWINAMTTAIEMHGLGAPSTVAMMRERGLTHVFIGQRLGRVGYTGPGPMDPHQIVGYPGFRLVYHEDQVWIFEIVP